MAGILKHTVYNWKGNIEWERPHIVVGVFIIKAQKRCCFFFLSRKIYITLLFQYINRLLLHTRKNIMTL